MKRRVFAQQLGSTVTRAIIVAAVDCLDMPDPLVRVQ
jgi:hypothetical protein